MEDDALKLRWKGGGGGGGLVRREGGLGGVGGGEKLTESIMTVKALPCDACAPCANMNARLTAHDGTFTSASATWGVLKRRPKRATARGIKPKSDIAAVARATEAAFEILRGE